MRRCKAVGPVLTLLYRLTFIFFRVIEDHNSNNIFGFIVIGKIAKFPRLKALCGSSKFFFLGWGRGQGNNNLV